MNPTPIIESLDVAGANAVDRNEVIRTELHAQPTTVWISGGPVATHAVTLDDPIDYALFVRGLEGAAPDNDVPPPLGGTPFGA